MTRGKQMDKAQAVAIKIAEKAAEVLAPLELEMALRRWSPDFREIMWNAVSLAASNRAKDAFAEIAEGARQ